MYYKLLDGMHLLGSTLLRGKNVKFVIPSAARFTHMSKFVKEIEVIFSIISNINNSICLCFTST